MKNKTRQIVALLVTAAMLTGCGAVQNQDVVSEQTKTQEETQTESVEEIQSKADTATEYSVIGQRPRLISTTADSSENISPAADSYTLEKDLSNVDNLWQFYLDDKMTELLAKNGFVVREEAGREFFDLYERNRYNMIPNFVTVDSLMHTYHVYFAYLLKNIEKEYLADQVRQLGIKMLEDSKEQYVQLKGSEWESAVVRNVAFFTVGAKLLDDTVQIEDYVSDIVESELSRIETAQGIMISGITDDEEDYSQYKPRGYYEGDSDLEAYFKAMMWYGRMHFKQEKEDLDRSALLITKALDSDSEAYELWQSVYSVTSFFAGASDDNGVCEYAPLIRAAYGENAKVTDLIGNGDAFLDYRTNTAALPVPQTNSIPIEDGEENVIPGFRFMGQRFSIDAMVMQKLIYSNVQSNSAGEKRMLPDVLDVPAALGSDVALNLLKENGVEDYPGYMENMEKLRGGINEADDSLWNASLYASWIQTLRPLLEKKGEGYPMFMQNEEWAKKNLECFAGSYTELKHDTVLYSKQVMAEMGGGMEEEPDDRGYVEPEPVVYERFASLAEQTAQGLKKYQMLSDADENNLVKLEELALRLQTISNKELQNETLTDEEYDLIRTYGGNIEHFWYDAMRANADSDTIFSEEYPAALVVDIATDPNGSVLEAATGDPSQIIVAVQVDGKIKLASGSVYTFYQFEQPLNDRLTDTQWRVMMGIEANDDMEYQKTTDIKQPAWTDSYRYHYEW
ncbi:MAG: DUF3160 domain-containing protein [Lachnospiraceae bacterium]